MKKHILKEVKTFKFYKENNGDWYVDLPSWEGSKYDLQMVMGADTMLDILSNCGSEVSIIIEEEPIDFYDFKLTFKEDYCDGGMYEYTSAYNTFDVWLCHVTKFVYNKLPKVLYGCVISI